jgi:hypothetical protein
MESFDDMRSRIGRYTRYIVEHQLFNPLHLPLHGRYKIEIQRPI